MKNVLRLLLSIFLFNSFLCYSSITTSQMVNIADKQRMLSQKLAKIYLLKAYGANLTDIKTEFDTSLIIFERNLETLEASVQTLDKPQIEDLFKQEKRTWRTFRKIIEKPIDETEVRKVLHLSNQLLYHCNNLLVAVKKENQNYVSDPDLMNIIDKSGTQRMYAQRLCLYFLAKKFDLKEEIDSLRNNVTLYSAYREVEDILPHLLNFELNTLETQKLVGKAMITFENLRSQKLDFLDGKASLNIVNDSINQLTLDFDELTLAYTELNINNTNNLSSN